jgi:hypothetical protein
MRYRDHHPSHACTFAQTSIALNSLSPTALLLQDSVQQLPEPRSGTAAFRNDAGKVFFDSRVLSMALHVIFGRALHVVVSVFLTRYKTLTSQISQNSRLNGLTL